MRAINLSYPIDLSDEQWELLAPLLPDAQPGDRPRSVDLRGWSTRFGKSSLQGERGGCCPMIIPIGNLHLYFHDSAHAQAASIASTLLKLALIVWPYIQLWRSIARHAQIEFNTLELSVLRLENSKTTHQSVVLQSAVA
jgi:transposase